MTLGFEELVVGDTVEFKGPLGSFKWLGKGTASWRGVERKAKNVGMICAGSGGSFAPIPSSCSGADRIFPGITPIIQVARAIVDDEHDHETKVWVLNANKTEEDILLRADMDELRKRRGPDRFRQHLVLSKAKESWLSSRGRVNLEMLRSHLPPPCADSLVLICGPEPLSAIFLPSRNQTSS